MVQNISQTLQLENAPEGIQAAQAAQQEESKNVISEAKPQSVMAQADDAYEVPDLMQLFQQNECVPMQKNCKRKAMYGGYGVKYTQTNRKVTKMTKMNRRHYDNDSDRGEESE